MKLTVEQEKVFKGVLSFFKSKKREIRVLAGGAGTGKSVLISEIYKALRNDFISVGVLSLTGRAASVLVNKGITEARTIFSFLYYPQVDKGTNELVGYFKRWDNPRTRLEMMQEYDALIVDEASMVSSEIFADLLQVGKSILFCGDQYQLPPIEKVSQVFNLFESPDFVLDTIHRQALENPIIRLSAGVRETGKIQKKFVDGYHIKLFDKREAKAVKHVESHSADVVLCGLNKTRIGLNEKIRGYRKYIDESVQIGETIICLRNRELDGRLFYNGERFIVVGKPVTVPQKFLNTKIYDDLEMGRAVCLEVQSLDIANDRKTYHVVVLTSLWADEKEPKQKGYFYGTWGYCITVHKSQGGEWGRVVFINEDVSYFLKEPFRFLYTAITRSRDKLVIYD